MSLGPTQKPGQTTLSEINVTPLVDVMLVLLIIFMVTAPMLQQGFDVNLPQEGGGDALDPSRERLVITLAIGLDLGWPLGRVGTDTAPSFWNHQGSLSARRSRYPLRSRGENDGGDQASRHRALGYRDCSG